jgi:hypothetical protein
MNRRRAMALLGVAVLVLAFAFEANGASDVAKVDKVNWWSKRPAAQPTTGDTSFEVASGPDGNESVAAIRVLIFGSVTKATLVISEAANQTTTVSVPKLQACLTSQWTTLNTSPGPYAQAPKPDCTKPVALVRDDKGNWTGDITAMLQGAFNERDVMVMPADDKTLPIPPTFFVQFATSRVEADGTPDVTTTTRPPTTAGIAAPSINSSTPSGPVSAPSRVTASPPTSAAPPPTTAPAKTAQPVPTRIGGPPVNAAAKRKQWGKLTWIVPFSAAIAFGWILFRKYVIDRRLLAST